MFLSWLYQVQAAQIPGMELFYVSCFLVHCLPTPYLVQRKKGTRNLNFLHLFQKCVEEHIHSGPCLQPQPYLRLTAYAWSRRDRSSIWPLFGLIGCQRHDPEEAGVISPYCRTHCLSSSSLHGFQLQLFSSIFKLLSMNPLAASLWHRHGSTLTNHS